MSYGEELTSWTSDRQHLLLATGKHHQWGRVIGFTFRFDEAVQRARHVSGRHRSSREKWRSEVLAANRRNKSGSGWRTCRRFRGSPRLPDHRSADLKTLRDYHDQSSMFLSCAHLNSVESRAVDGGSETVTRTPHTEPLPHRVEELYHAKHGRYKRVRRHMAACE